MTQQFMGISFIPDCRGLDSTKPDVKEITAVLSLLYDEMHMQMKKPSQGVCPWITGRFTRDLSMN